MQARKVIKSIQDFYNEMTYLWDQLALTELDRLGNLRSIVNIEKNNTLFSF